MGGCLTYYCYSTPCPDAHVLDLLFLLQKGQGVRGTLSGKHRTQKPRMGLEGTHRLGSLPPLRSINLVWYSIGNFSIKSRSLRSYSLPQERSRCTSTALHFSKNKECVRRECLNGPERGLSPAVPGEVKNKKCHVFSPRHFVSLWFQTDTLPWSFQMLKYFGNLIWLPIDTTTACLCRQTRDWATKDGERSSHWGEVWALELILCSCRGVGVRSGTSYASLDSFWPQVIFTRVIFLEMLSTCHWDLVFRCASSWALK